MWGVAAATVLPRGRGLNHGRSRTRPQPANLPYSEEARPLRKYKRPPPPHSCSSSPYPLLSPYLSRVGRPALPKIGLILSILMWPPARPSAFLRTPSFSPSSPSTSPISCSSSSSPFCSRYYPLPSLHALVHFPLPPHADGQPWGTRVYPVHDHVSSTVLLLFLALFLLPPYFILFTLFLCPPLLCPRISGKLGSVVARILSASGSFQASSRSILL